MFLPKLKLSSSIVLPTVYSDSLSYYEELNKIKWYINQLIDGMEIDPNNISYKGELVKFGETWWAPLQPFEIGIYSVDTTSSEAELEDTGFPAHWYGKGEMLITQYVDGTQQATLITEEGVVYTNHYRTDGYGWDNEWNTEDNYVMKYNETITDITTTYNSEDIRKKFYVYFVSNQNAVGFPDNKFGAWTQGLLIHVKTGFPFFVLFADNGVTYTQPFGSNDWVTDYGEVIDLTEHVTAGVTMGEHSYLKYRKQGKQIYIDGEFNSVPNPDANQPNEPTVIVNEGLPHHSFWAMLLPFSANAGKITGVCSVGVNGDLKVLEAFNTVTATRINGTGGYIEFLQIHATYSIE